MNFTSGANYASSSSSSGDSFEKDQNNESFSSSSVSSESQPSSLSMTCFSKETESRPEVQSEDEYESFIDEGDIFDDVKPPIQKEHSKTSFSSRRLSVSNTLSCGSGRSNALDNSQGQSNLSQPMPLNTQPSSPYQSWRSNALSNNPSESNSFQPMAQNTSFRNQDLSTNSGLRSQTNCEQFVDEEAHESIPILDDKKKKVSWKSKTVAESFEDEDAFASTRNFRKKLEKNGLTKKKRCFFALTTSIFLVGGMIGLIVYLFNAGKFGSGDRNIDLNVVSLSPSISPGSSGQYQNSTTSSTPIILPPPSNLNASCSKESLMSTMLLCPIQCRKSECCYIPNNQILYGQESCLNTNKNICEQYSPSCDLVYGPLPSDNFTSNATNLTTKIPSAPADLVSMCTDGNIEACLNACFDGYCCFSAALDILAGVNTTGPSCYEKQQCSGYYPCLLGIMSFLPSDVTNKLPRADTDTLEELCSEGSLVSQAGAVLCLNQCMKALCCFDTSCAAENLGACATYSPCIRVLESMVKKPTNPPSTETGMSNNTENIGEESNEIPSPSTDLAGLCDFGDTEGTIDQIQKCAIACEAAFCCLQQGENSCLMDQLFVCLEYTPCNVLVTLQESIDVSSDSIPAPIFDVDLACTEVSLSTEKGRIECIQGCYAGLCCTSPLEPCVLRDIFSCIKYRPCEVVVDQENGGFKGIVPLLNVSEDNRSNITLQPPPSNLSNICAIEKFSNDEGTTECYNICSQANCCTTNVANCYEFNTEVCNLYADCLNLLIIESSMALNLPTKTPAADSESFQPPPSDLSILCSSDDDLFSPECFSVCEKASCCLDSENSCKYQNPEWCFLYSPCMVLENKTKVQRACSTEATLECKLLCQEGSCCFPNQSNAISCDSNTEYCSYYQPCSLIFQDKSQGGVDGSNSLTEICDVKMLGNNTAEWKECNDACKEAWCCFFDPAHNESCRDSIDFCSEYGVCEVAFHAEEANNTGALTEVPAIDACVPEKVESSNAAFLHCKLFCLEANCCFLPEDDVENCINDIPFCTRFAACDIVFKSNETPAPSAIQDENSIELFCNNVTVASMEGKATCLNLCRPGGCCFLGHTSEKSCHANEKFCRDYEACAILFGQMDTTSPALPEPSVIEIACSADSSFPAFPSSECKQLCSEGACCYLDESSADSCRNNVDFCSYYAICDMKGFKAEELQTELSEDTEMIAENPQDVVDKPTPLEGNG
eukprot:CAMPEP_0194210208 /NCGR_PEP_ID=MMETSP0156-20130528/8086_1 /TAXON_ID=33649 /ORGANISM="Thalassionema nitzschioides, Strain L26-B" /LENGTH=1226 /DNA_ID=CAMNT_0038937527 /DNA_START=34 /DNA_END=3714 /DNA_ORIENTATION=+